MSDWDKSQKVCGNCRFWLLGHWQQDGAEPRGAGGVGSDGGVSECRRRAPFELIHAMHLHGSAAWPTTKRLDWCGDYDSREVLS